MPFSEYDKFGEEGISRAEYVKKQTAVVGKCLCAGCPSYIKGDEMVGYCFPLNGASNVIKWEKGCLCETCPVFKEYDLDHTYYCTRCSQACQTYKIDAAIGN